MSLGTLIRKVNSEDHDQILALLAAAFGQPDEADIVKQLWAERAVKIERVAEMGGVVVGYVAYSTITTHPVIDGMLLGLGPLAVAPDHQRRRVGTALVEETLSVCQENAARLIAVLGDPAYYARFGFEPASERKMSWAGFDAGDAFRVIAGSDIDTDQIRTIHYHRAFDAKG